MGAGVSVHYRHYSPHPQTVSNVHEILKRVTGVAPFLYGFLVGELRKS